MCEEDCRPIDANALKKALNSNCDICPDKNTNWCERCCPHNDFEDLIDDAPTIEPINTKLINQISVNITEEEKQEIIEKLRKEPLILSAYSEPEIQKDDCEGCKYEDKASTDYPCTVCKNNHPNMFEWRNEHE